MSRPRNAMRRPLREKKYVRSVAIPGEYRPMGRRQTIFPSETRAALALAWYRARIGAYNAAAYALQRSPLWRRRHPPLE